MVPLFQAHLSFQSTPKKLFSFLDFLFVKQELTSALVFGMGKERHFFGWKIFPPSQGHGMVSQQQLHSSLLTLQPFSQQGAEFLPPSPSKNPNQILVKFLLLNLPPFLSFSRFFSLQVRSSGSSQQGEGRCGLSRGLCGTMRIIFFIFFLVPLGGREGSVCEWYRLNFG